MTSPLRQDDIPTVPIRVTARRRDEAPGDDAPGPAIPAQGGQAAEAASADAGEPRGLVAKLRILLDAIFGLGALVAGLALVAVIPVLQLVSFGYLLAMAAKVAETGRLRDGFLGLHKAAKLGRIVAGVWIVLVPLRLLSTLVSSGRIIAAEGGPTRGLELAFLVISALAFLHIALALTGGGRVRDFLIPFHNPLRVWRGLRRHGPVGYYMRLSDGFMDFVAGLRLPWLFSLGLRGLLGSLLWLVVPVTLCAAGPRAPILGILGALLLMAVAAILPFLQAEFARQDRIRVFLEPGQVREAFRSAPLAFLFALTLALVLPVPLYLLKIEMLPSEAGTLASFVFIVFMIPSRLLTGWALARGLRREERGHVILRGGARLAMVPVLALYVGLVFASRLISWEGVAAMYSQHAFLLPVPFSSFS